MAAPIRTDTIRAKTLDDLLRELNQLFRDIATAINGRLTFAENMSSEIRDVVVTGGAFPFTFSTKFQSPPAGVVLLYVVEDTQSPATLTSAVFLDWQFSSAAGGGITLRYVAGLTTGVRYKMRLLVVGG